MPRWTDEAKAKQAELIRSWRPWEHSTGAKTPEGKAKVAMNSPGRYWRERLRLTCWIGRQARHLREGRPLVLFDEIVSEYYLRGRKFRLDLE